MISLSRVLISFLQLSHLWTSIGEKELMLVRFRALRSGPRASAAGLRAGGVVRRRRCSPVGAPRLLNIQLSYSRARRDPGPPEGNLPVRHSPIHGSTSDALRRGLPISCKLAIEGCTEQLVLHTPVHERPRPAG